MRNWVIYFIFNILYLANNLSLAQVSRSISSIASAKESFAEKEFVLLDSNWIQFDEQLFPLDSSRFFYINYLFSGESINKRLSQDDQLVFLLRQDLFSIDDILVDEKRASDFALYYYNAERQTSEKITTIKFNLESNDKFVDEVEELLKKPGFQEKPENEIITALANRWRYKYGFIDGRSIQSLIFQAKRSLNSPK